MSGSVLVLFAHPALHRSRANRRLFAALDGAPGITTHDLYRAYPDMIIDVEREQELIVSHSALVLQHPLYWYSAPAILKEWLDVVLEHGFAYGAAGTALRGKPWMQAVTAGGRAEAYQPAGHNRFPIEELLRPFEMTAKLCGADWRPPFVTYGAHLIDDAALTAAAGRYRAAVCALAPSAAPAAVPAMEG